MNKKSAKMSNALVVYKNPPPQKKKNKNNKNKNKKKNGKMMTFGDDTAHYGAALLNPFHSRAFGAKVPDLFAAPTMTFNFRTSHSFMTGASGSVGVVFFPNLTLSAYTYESATAPSYFAPITWGDNSAVSGSGWGYGIPGNIQTYRIVSYGIRVTNTSSMTNAAGKFILGSYPIDSYAAIKSSGIGPAGATNFTVDNLVPATNSVKSPANTTTAWGYPTGIAGPSYGTLIQYPGAVTISAVEMAEKEYDVISRPVDPRAFQFRSVDTLIGYDGVDQVATGFTGRADKYALNGHEALFAVLTGAPSGASFDVEIIYHIEATLAPVTTAVGGATEDSCSTPPVDPIGFEKVLTSILTFEPVREVIKLGADMLHPLLGKFARAVL